MSRRAYENDQILGSVLKELTEKEAFEAQLELENRMIDSFESKLKSLSLTSSNLAMEYVSVRAMLDTMQKLQAKRSEYIENRNNRRPA